MSVKSSSLLAGLMAAALVCVSVSCGSNESAAKQGQQRGNTLAGAADTTSKSRGKQAQGELRLPDAPIVAAPAQPPAGGVATGTAAMSRGATGAPASLTQPPAAAPAAAPAGPTDISDVPLAPKEAQWTIFCASLADPSHVETSRALKAALIKRTGLKEWYLLHEGNQSRLYYGFYRSINDPADKAETARAQADRKKIDALEDGDKERPFRACQFVKLTAPDPESPAEWDLANAPPDKVWTLLIAAYKDHPERKKAAVETVRDARARGEEAYYYHGPNVSNVFIGAWPEDAVAEEQVDPDADKRKAGRADLLVLPPGMKADRNIKHKDGRAVAAVGQRLVPVDEGMKAKIQQYPELAVNGEVVEYQSRGKRWREQTQLKRIPRSSDTLFAGGIVEPGQTDGRGLDPQDPFSRPGVEDSAAAAAASDPAAGGSGAPPPPRTSSKSSNAPGPGRLKSLGK
jgi:hypothetical protein